MNLRLFFCIVMGVVVAHIGAFMMFTQLRPKPKLAPPLPPNFSAKAKEFVDAETGEKSVYREITVTTKFATAAGTPAPATPVVREVPIRKDVGAGGP